MNAVGDGYGGEGCPHYVPGHGCKDALPSRNRGHGEGFQSPSANRPWNDSGEIGDLFHAVLIESLWFKCVFYTQANRSGIGESQEEK
eukprot:245867-Heterocapsa_arctica.AAC.1